jgi:hypothetical protein
MDRLRSTEVSEETKAKTDWSRTFKLQFIRIAMFSILAPIALVGFVFFMFRLGANGIRYICRVVRACAPHPVTFYPRRV